MKTEFTMTPIGRLNSYIKMKMKIEIEKEIEIL